MGNSLKEKGKYDFLGGGGLKNITLTFTSSFYRNTLTIKVNFHQNKHLITIHQLNKHKKLQENLKKFERNLKNKRMKTRLA